MTGEGAVYLGGAARLIAFRSHGDERGVLTPIAFDDMPFRPVRSFFVNGVPQGTLRGGHAHRSARQLLLCLSGQIRVVMRYEDQETTVLLDGGGPGLLIEARVWARQEYVSDNAIMLAMVSEPFSPDTYLPDGPP